MRRLQSMEGSLPPPLLQNRACHFCGTRLLSEVPFTIGVWLAKIASQTCGLAFHASPLQGIAPSRSRTGSSAFPALLLPNHLHFTVLTSAYPRHDPRPWLLEESLPVHHTVGTCSRLSRRGRTGLLRSQFPWLASVGRCSPPGFYGRADRSVWKAAGAVSCAVLAPARQPLALVGVHDGSNTPLLALPIDACETGYPE